MLFLHAAQVFKRNTTDLRIESIQQTTESIRSRIDSLLNRFSLESIQPGESIQLPLPFLPSSFAYTHPIELGVGPLGSQFIGFDQRLIPVTNPQQTNQLFNQLSLMPLYDNNCTQCIRTYPKSYQPCKVNEIVNRFLF